jgi:hypothetical protein
MTNKNTSTIATIILFIGVVVVLFYVLKVGIEKEAMVECYKLESQSKEFKGKFFLTQSESDMCIANGFYIEAPVK